ncbi:hydantoinase/oxoprolinase family protein [Limobrevibacterium gyesilva]|uniref:Hydantoinase/oxoprolinase family protein n=1 Tax=Limobrevibacterium gyesilva TaxID=2991712 RepID=A0AA42CF76_9PROT|nr:hydantoinase/oxoprolinase family protein [Limobrevibacterium gyesilva]MCW3476224.1 hydantoinase/oxoprolinase family protein [Limobrevibacterium gyesilva]
MSRGENVVGVDVGGTFTDLFLFDAATGTARVGKVPSTRGREADGFAEGITGLAPLADISAIVHGTTVGTNALLERKGARAGLITTAGFRDVLEMRRRDRRQTWGLTGTFVPVIERDMRVEVAERTLADGSILTAVDPAEVRAAAQRLLDAGAEALCIVFLHSYANPANERAALEAVRTIWPNAHIAISSDILPEIREFERTSTAALNAVLQPVVGGYIAALDATLRQGGFGGAFLIVQSNGGVMSVETAARLPVRTALSGPAAGVIAAAHIATEAGFPDVITGDIGGTSFDVSLVAGGVPALAAQSTLDFGLVVRTPMIEITTIGAGGGSIARVDAAGLLQVGPQSAGSIPGPVCYGAGGDRPTVTDANVVLGRINAERPIGGKFARLDAAAAARVIARDVGAPLRLDVVAAAEAILRVANARMAGALRLVSIERGHDPKKFTLMPFGGGGALHAGALIRDVGLARALVPRFPGVTSALGCVIADMRHDRVRTLNRMLAELDPAALRAEMDAAASSLAALLNRAGMAFTARRVAHALDMNYAGQTHTVAVPLPLEPDGSGELSQARIAAAFEAAYSGSYGRLLPGVPMRVLNLRSAVTGVRPKIDLLSMAPTADASIESARRGRRRVWFDGWTDTPVFGRLGLPVGAVIAGPAVLEQPDTTILIEPGLSGRVDRFGNLILEASR